jgi:hypothetical protein
MVRSDGRGVREATFRAAFTITFQSHASSAPKRRAPRQGTDQPLLHGILAQFDAAGDRGGDAEELGVPSPEDGFEGLVGRLGRSSRQHGHVHTLTTPVSRLRV